jgi:hypothetical protein
MTTKVHVTLMSGEHFKITGSEALKFLEKIDGPVERLTADWSTGRVFYWVDFTCGGWEMRIRYDRIEALSIDAGGNDEE